MVSRKREMELSKEEMELFLPFPVIRSKNFLHKSFSIWSTTSKLVFRNRKWNYVNRKCNYFSPFQLSDQNTYSIKVIPIGSLILKWLLETENGVLQIGNGIFSPLSSYQIKKLFFTKVSLFGLLLSNWFSELGNGIM